MTILLEGYENMKYPVNMSFRAIHDLYGISTGRKAERGIKNDNKNTHFSNNRNLFDGS